MDLPKHVYEVEVDGNETIFTFSKVNAEELVEDGEITDYDALIFFREQLNAFGEDQQTIGTEQLIQLQQELYQDQKSARDVLMEAARNGQELSDASI